MSSRKRRSLRLLAVVTAVLVTGCGGSTPSAPTSPSPTVSRDALNIQGDPESAQGATWTFTGTIGGVAFDLQGVLFKPRGAGPFPAVILSHGAGGNATLYGRNLAPDMVTWGLVCIATNYTHAGGVPLGAPGSSAETGASEPNVQRAHAALELMRMLGYVDMSRVAAHGHSMGAFVTAALIGTYPADFRAASHTAGGVRPANFIAGPAPTESQVRSIRTPYQLHHGDADSTVPIAQDQRLATILQSVGTTYELHIYPGAEHNDVLRNAAVLDRVRGWYQTHGVLAR